MMKICLGSMRFVPLRFFPTRLVFPKAHPLNGRLPFVLNRPQSKPSTEILFLVLGQETAESGAFCFFVWINHLRSFCGRMRIRTQMFPLSQVVRGCVVSIAWGLQTFALVSSDGLFGDPWSTSSLYHICPQKGSRKRIFLQTRCSCLNSMPIRRRVL